MGKLYNFIERMTFKARIIGRELSGKCIPINSYAWMDYNGTIDHSNWGDDINWYFLNEIVDGKLIPYFHSILTRRRHRPNYVVIGSTIDLIADSDSVIWGAGIIDSTTSSLPRFREIRAVRGPLTRRKLLDMGYDCPAVYGDPALLIPLYYRPAVSPRYRLGIIPHFHDLEAVREKYSRNSEIKVIDIRHYQHWHDFVDDIVECEAVATSSLHGLIMAQAYNVPNVWVEFREGEKRDPFKYHDFFCSIGKTDEHPLLLSEETDLQLVFDKLRTWRPGHLDLQPLIDAAPFKLKPYDKSLS